MTSRARDSTVARRTFVAMALLASCTCRQAFGAAVRDYAVEVGATVAVDPAAITLSWPLESRSTGYEVFRKLRASTSWGTAQAQLPGSATSWTDTLVSVGVQYEYLVIRTSTISYFDAAKHTCDGFVCAGIGIPVVDRRGTLVLVVDNTMSTPLAAELALLQRDLVGDGWAVIRHDVARSASVASVKALIKADYEAAPNEVKSVFLFGHIPVARSGDVAPAGHSPDHRGAFPADLYYGDMDGVWTDSTVNDTNATFVDCRNIPGDGKFDQCYIPPGTGVIGGPTNWTWDLSGRVELEVGRVDLFGLNVSFAPETDLLRKYLNKDHAHRHAIAVLPRRGLVTDKFGEHSGGAEATSGWRSWASLFGSANVSPGAFTNLATDRYLGYYANGGGANAMCDSITTALIASSDPKAAFWIMYGSHFADWNYSANILRAPLATSLGLTCVYGMPLWYYHVLALGGTFGAATRLNQHNVYPDGTQSWVPFYGPMSAHNSGVHISLMGDPTLRLHAVGPVTNVAATNGPGGVALGWTASLDTVVGYHVYRATGASGPFARITSDVVVGTSLTDAGVTAGTYTYMVRAIKLETSAGGTYYNSSQGAFATIAYVPRQAPPTELTAVAADAAVTLSWTASVGADSYTVKRAFTSGGPYTAIAADIAVTNHADSGLTNGIAHFYVVAAVAHGEEGVDSREVSALPLSAFQAWQVTFFGCATGDVAAATADPDRDGMNNEQEFLAGTHPGDPGSALRITAFRLRLKFQPHSCTLHARKPLILSELGSIVDSIFRSICPHVNMNCSL